MSPFTKLKDFLKELKNGESLYYLLNTIESKVTPILAKITETFPEYTPHDISHCQNILSNINIIIPNELRDRLNEYEIFFLIASIYMHDLGKVNFPELSAFFGKDANSIRDNHHLRSELFIINNYKNIGLEDEHQAHIIGRICRGHRKEDLNNAEIFEHNRIYKNQSTNVALLSALLRLADELDLTFQRTPAVIYEHIPPKDNISKSEWDRHLSVSGVALHPEDALIIKGSAICKNPKIHRVLKRLETKINDELGGLPNHLHQYREFKKSLPRIFRFEIKAIGYKTYDFKFTLQEKEIINLLMGDKLYSRKEEALRELIKNSVDACKLRGKYLEEMGENFLPQIIVELSADNKKIEVIDNGLGMDETIIEKYFIKIGHSFYKSREFLEKNYNYTPVSELGIGFLSCFMIADKVIIETKTYGNNALIIEIDDISEYFIVKDGNRVNPGTTVTLFLKDRMNLLALRREIEYYARHIEYPIKIKTHDGPDFVVRDAGYDCNLKLLLNHLPRKYFFHAENIENEYVEGKIGVLVENDLDSGLKLTITNWNTFYPLMRYELKELDKRLFLSYEGVFIGHVDVIPSWFKRMPIYLDINLKRNIVDLNVARNDIIRNRKYDKFNNIFEDILIKCLRNLLRIVKANCNKLDRNYRSIYAEFFNNYFSIKKKLANPKLVTLLKSHYYFRSISFDGIEYVRYADIPKNSQTLTIIEGFEGFKPNYIIDTFNRCKDLPSNSIFLLREHSDSIFAAQTIFKSVKIINYFGVIKIKKFDGLHDIIPIEWDMPCVRFINYETHRMIELMRLPKRSTHENILNIDNRFINLIITNKATLNDELIISLKEFIRLLRYNSQKREIDFNDVLNLQFQILKKLVELGILFDNEIIQYAYCFCSGKYVIIN